MLMLLSLDAGLPFWEDMGLSVASTKRPIVQRYARLAYKNFQGGQEDFYSADYTDQIAEKAVESFLNAIDMEADKSMADKVHDWCLYHYCDGGSDGAVEFQWYGSLISLKNEYPNLSCPLDIKADVLKRIVSIITKGLYRPFFAKEAALEEAEKLPRSKWDAVIFKSMAADDYSPLIGISGMITHTSFKRVWVKLIALLTKNEIKSLLRWHVCFAKRRHMVMEFVKLPNSAIPDRLKKTCRSFRFANT